MLIKNNYNPSIFSKRENMRYTGLELFMGKLKQMIYSNDNPFINNHPSILYQRPQFQLLYEELHSMIQTLLLIDEHHELQQVTDLKNRFKDAAQEANDVVDLFVYTINLGNQISLNLEDVMRSIKSIKEEFMVTMINDHMKMDSSPRTDPWRAQSAAGTSRIRNPLGKKKVKEDIVVGFDRHAELIRDKLVEDRKQLDVVCIVGMGGLGKTTLATKVFNDPFVMYHFHVRGWVTVSQTYEKQDLLIQILESTGIELDNIVRGSYSRLREMLHKRLISKRYLIVIDDVWSTEAWDDLKLFFPNNHTRSRIMLTSRLNEVALHSTSHGYIHRLEYLTEGESWELLRKQVFHGTNDCPKSLIEPGMQIAKNCHGLPLTLVVVAGVLAKEAVTKDSWERIGQSVSFYIVSEQTGCIETLALSIDQLPGPLRGCFLYLGGFPEDYKFRVQRLIWLWVAEGFILEDGIRSLEEIAEDYLLELVDRNLIVVAARKSNGGIKTFYVHDLLREICQDIATKEGFFLKTPHTLHSVASIKQRRIFIEHDINILNAPTIRSLLCVSHCSETRNLISNWSHFWMLLMVLDLRNLELDYFPEEISLLVHLRYLAFWYDGDFPSLICNLWSLQTLIVRGVATILKLPNTISNMVNLRHLQCEGRDIFFPAIQRPMKLQTISNVLLGDGPKGLVKCFPDIKKLSCLIQPDMKYDFHSLSFLEELKLRTSVFVRVIFPTSELNFKKNHIGFPASLKALTLEHCYLPWSDMSIIQSLPKLLVLKLLANAFEGPRWDAGEEQFEQLEFLKLSGLRIKQWKASGNNFPCLKKLVLERCYRLEEIPSNFGYIPTLELINIYRCKDSTVKSLDIIQKEQHAQGNFELKVSVARPKPYVYGFRV